MTRGGPPAKQYPSSERRQSKKSIIQTSSHYFTLRLQKPVLQISSYSKASCSQYCKASRPKTRVKSGCVTEPSFSGQIKNYEVLRGGPRAGVPVEKSPAYPAGRACSNMKCNAHRPRGSACTCKWETVLEKLLSLWGPKGSRPVVGDDVWEWYVRIHVRDRRYFLYLIYYEF